MRALAWVAVATLVSGCVAAPQHPDKRPVTTQSMAALAKAPVVVDSANEGIQKSWFRTDSSAAGAAYGLIGALVTSAIDAATNSGPARRASGSASSVANAVPPDTLDELLVARLRAAAQEPGSPIGEVRLAQKLLVPGPVDGAIELLVTYDLAEDASALRMIAKASYQSTALHYVSPYPVKGQVPKEDLAGPAYANTFTYRSAQFPPPVMAPGMEQQLVDAVTESYRRPSGGLPLPEGSEGKDMARDIAAAKDGKLTKEETAVFLVHEWLRDDAAALRRELAGAHDFLARYLAIDLATTTLPTLEGSDEVLETLADGRVVKRVGRGLEAGSYVSAPGNVSAFATWGNAEGVSRQGEDRISALKKQAKDAKPGSGAAK